MTFLELCKRTIEKCGISGSIATVTGQTGESLRVVNWVDEAWRDIQGSQSNWDWMREDFSFQSVASTQSYTPTAAGATDFGKWHKDTLRIYLTSTGVSDDSFLCEWDYRTFRDLYMFGVQQTGKPVVFAEKPGTHALLLGSIPDAVYTVYGEYQLAATAMTADADIPSMDEQFHMAIVHLARMKYAAYEAAGANLSINLTGAMWINFAAAYSDYHVTGLNPAGNACLADLAFVASRFRIVQRRRPA